MNEIAQWLLLRACPPRPPCQHDWRITRYSALRQGEDRPDTVFLRCAKCGEESMEEFQ